MMAAFLPSILLLGAAKQIPDTVSPAQMAKIRSTAIFGVENMIRGAQSSRARRNSNQHTDCASCLADTTLTNGYFWNGFVCAPNSTFGAGHYFAIWGQGYETNCSKPSGVTFAVEAAGCGSEGDQTCVADPTTGSKTLKAGFQKMTMASNPSFSITNNDPNNCALLNQIGVDMSISTFSADNSGSEDPGFPYLDQQYAHIAIGEWASIDANCGGKKKLTVVRALSALDSVYWFNQETCAKGVDPAESGCSPGDIIKTATMHEFKSSTFTLRSMDTTSVTNLAKYTFCYSPSPATTDTYGCIHVTIPQFITQAQATGSVSAAPNSGSFTCQSITHTLDLLDIEWAFDFRQITYNQVPNQRYGFRFLTTQQTGGVEMSTTDDDSDSDSDIELTDTSGFTKMKFEKSMIVNNNADATCNIGARDNDMLNKTKADLTISGGTTSCGDSTIFNAAWKASADSQGFDNIDCHFANFMLDTQPTHILWDPETSIDADEAKKAQQSRSSSSASSGSNGIAPTFAAVVLALFFVFA